MEYKCTKMVDISKTYFFSITIIILAMLSLPTFCFDCSMIKNSTCDCVSTNDRNTISCPNLTAPDHFDYNIHRAYVQLKCNQRAINVSMMPENFNFDDKIESFDFETCKLPNISIDEVMNHFGIRQRNLKIIFKGLKSDSNVLESYHLKNLENITELTLSGGFIHDVNEILLSDVKELKLLKLMNSKNIKLHSDALKNVPKLISLTLDNNNLNYLPSELFIHSTALERLFLLNNKLKNITMDSFIGLNSLTLLKLNGYEIFELYPNTFKNIPRLYTLHLSNNKAKTLEVNLPDNFLSGLKNLSEVIIVNSKIGNLSETVFAGSVAIKKIYLTKNKIQNLPKNIFKDLINLEELYLHDNEIIYLHENIFESLSKVIVLDLNSNCIEKLSGKIFYNLKSLEKLYINNNKLNILENDIFRKISKLKIIDMSKNNLTLEMKNQDVSPFSFLQHCILNLDLSNNFIETISVDLLFITNLQYLNLSNNIIEDVNEADLNFISKKAKVDLRNNGLKNIFFSNEGILNENKSNDNHTVIDIKDNPINCDCEFYNFFNYLKHQNDKMIRFKFDATGCESPPRLKNKILDELNLNDITCQIDNCHLTCSCSYRKFDEITIVNCSSKNPPYNITLPDRNYIEMYLENNSIKRMSDLKLNEENVNQIKSMYFANNNISSIQTSDIPKYIEVLDLRNNSIKYVTPEVVGVLRNLSTLKSISFLGNPIECDCRNLEFISFLQTNYEKVTDMNILKCRSGELISTYELNTLCFDYIAIIAFFIAAILLMVVVAIYLYYKYQQEIKIWLYAKRFFLWCITEKEVDRNKIYDAFISFSHKDEEFVVKSLLPGLENGPYPLKICIHYRDWIVGEFIPTQILKSVDDSRRTLIILSPDFLQSVWGKMEFKVAHTQALKEGRARVIIILYGDIDPKDISDPELNMYINTNTYLKWGDPRFWDKLRYALPHPNVKHQMKANTYNPETFPKIATSKEPGGIKY